MARRNNSKFVIGLMVVFVVIILFAVVFPYMGFFAPKAELVSVPEVQSTIKSKDGEFHNVKAKIELDIKGNKKVDVYTMEAKITDTLSKLDYEKLSAENGDEYLKASIGASISEYVKPEELNDIILTEFQRDYALTPDTAPKNDKRDDILKGMFQNIK